MPTIASFYGILIRIHLFGAEHNPPHVHVSYAEYSGVYNIRTANKIEGRLPVKADSLVREWILLNKDALLRIWETQQLEELIPLD